jgi:hypothetical protein
MVTNKHSSMDRRQRRKIVGEWEELLVEEEKQEALRIQTHGQSTSRDDTPSINTSVAGLKEDKGVAEVWRLLGNLGLLVDVKAMMEEMDSDDFQCWRSLRKISLYRDEEIGLRPDQEIQRLTS